MTALVRICDLAGRPRGSGFVADDGGTVVTGHEAVDGLDRVVLHAPGERTWLAGPEAIAPLPEFGLALVRTDGLGLRPLPVSPRDRVPSGTYVRLAARGWRQARVLGETEVAYTADDRAYRLAAALELAIGTDGSDALRLGGEVCGGPVLDAGTGAVLAVLGSALHAEHRSAGFAVPLRAAAAADPAGPLARLLARNAATVPGYGADLNLAGALQLTATCGCPPATGPEFVERPDVAREFAAFEASEAVLLGLAGDPGTGRSAELAALAARRARGPQPAPTVLLRGADLAATDTAVADAVARALGEAGRILAAAGADGDMTAATPDRIAALARAAGRPLLVLLDGPEEMPAALAHRLAGWTAGTARWLRAAGARMVVACRTEHWERAAALYPPQALHRPLRAARGLPGAVRLGGLPAPQAALARAKYGIPEGVLGGPDAAHPLALRLLAEVRAAGVTGGRPDRDAVFGAHLDLMCLRIAVRLAAGEPSPPRGPAVRRLAARVSGRVHEAARHCLGPGGGALERAAFEELFPWRTGWAAAVLAEGLLLPAGPGYRFAHEELADWLQSRHLDLPATLATLVHRRADGDPAAARGDVRAGGDRGQGTGQGGGTAAWPRERIGPVWEALRRAEAAGGTPDGQLMGLVEALHARPDPDAGWWAARLLRATLLRCADAERYLPVLHALAEHVAETGPGAFGGWFWNRLPVTEPVRLDLLRRLLPSDAPPADARPGDAPSADAPRADGPHPPGGVGAFGAVRSAGGPGPSEPADGSRPSERAGGPGGAAPADCPPGTAAGAAGPADRFIDAAARRLRRDPRGVQPLLCGWFTDERALRGRPGATVATAAQALLHTHRRLAVDELTETLVGCAHPRADELLAALAEEEPSALCRAVDRWSHDPRPERRVAAAAYGPLAARHADTAADRELLRYAALALLARPEDGTLHGAALALLVRDPDTRSRYLPAALERFAAGDPRLPADALAVALATHPDPVFAAFRDRLRAPRDTAGDDAGPGVGPGAGAGAGSGTGAVLRALAEVTEPVQARRAAALVREHLDHRPDGAAYAAAFVDRRLDHGPAARQVLFPLVVGLLRGRPAAVRRALAPVLAAPGTEASRPLRAELLTALLECEDRHEVLDAVLCAAAGAAAARGADATRELVRRTARLLARTPEGAAVLDLRLAELARTVPGFAVLAAGWLAARPQEWSAVLGPGARRTLETLAGADRADLSPIPMRAEDHGHGSLSPA
ncbi:serine protease [Streptomyces sp. NPDC002073]